jgi:hypothetical protein
MSRRAYPTNHSDVQWAVREPLVLPPLLGGRRLPIPAASSSTPCCMSFVAASPGAHGSVSSRPGRPSMESIRERVARRNMNAANDSFKISG